MAREWTLLSRRSILRRQPWFEIFEEQVRLPNGDVVPDFYSISIPEYVVVVGFDRSGHVLMERHYRHGVGAMTWSLPSGYIDSGEDALIAAKRELLEETGFASQSWEYLGRFAVDGNRGCGWANVFVAENVTQSAEPNSQDLAEIHVELVPMSRVMTAVMNGGVAELASVAALCLARSNRSVTRAAISPVSKRESLS